MVVNITKTTNMNLSSSIPQTVMVVNIINQQKKP